MAMKIRDMLERADRFCDFYIYDRATRELPFGFACEETGSALVSVENYEGIYSKYPHVLDWYVYQWGVTTCKDIWIDASRHDPDL